jgi:hypothetical protein
VPYEAERQFFSSLKGGLESDRDLSLQVGGAIETVLVRYNTVVWENRFVVGGVVEQILGSAARALGLAVQNAGKQNQGWDLELPSGLGLSVKGVFASMGGKHNLINYRGDASAAVWRTATIFVMSDTGIGYTDPDFGADLTSRSADALQISGKGLQEWWAEWPEWLIGGVKVPRKPTGPAARVASDPVAFDILQGFPRLTPHWAPEI